MSEPARHVRRSRKVFLDYGPVWLWPVLLGVAGGGITVGLLGILLLNHKI